MGHRTGQVNMTKTLTAHLTRDDLDTTLFTDDATVLHALVFAAIALIILGRAKNLGTEKTITFRLESPIVDRFGLLNLAERPFTNLFR